MQKHVLALALAVTLLAATGCGKHPRVYRAGELSATEAVAAPGTGAARATAAFLSIRNRSATDDELVKVTSPKVEAIEFHESVARDGTSEMRPAVAFSIPAGGRLALTPGGKHLMVFGLDPALKPGDRIPLSLTFRSGTVIAAEMTLVPAARAHVAQHSAHHSGAHHSGAHDSGAHDRHQPVTDSGGTPAPSAPP